MKNIHTIEIKKKVEKYENFVKLCHTERDTQRATHPLGVTLHLYYYKISYTLLSLLYPALANTLTIPPCVKL